MRKMTRHFNEQESKVTVMRYIFRCPAKDCNFYVKAVADNYGWAAEKITEASLFHVNHVHPEMSSVTNDAINKLFVKRIDMD
ncbi:MAG: hypothetical protein AB1552_07450 [Nitrospirota bacterium]